MEGVARQQSEALLHELLVLAVNGALQNFSATVFIVGKQRVPDVFHVYPDLVGAARFKLALHEADVVERLQGAVVGHGPLSLRPVGEAVADGGEARVSADMPFDAAVGRLWFAPDESYVAPFDGMVKKLLGQVVHRIFGLGDDQQARGVFVDAVDKADPVVEVAVEHRELGVLKMVGQGVDQGVFVMANPGVHHQPGGFVEHEQGIVLEDDIERDVLRLEPDTFAGRLGNDHLDLVAGPDFVIGLDLELVDPHSPHLDSVLQTAPRNLIEAVNEVFVDADLSLPGIDEDLVKIVVLVGECLCNVFHQVSKARFEKEAKIKICFIALETKKRGIELLFLQPKPHTMQFDSLCVREMPDKRTTDPHVLPIYATSSFAFQSIDQGIDIFTGKEKGHVYGRYGNPTIEAVADKIAAMEAYGTGTEAAALMVSSGMAAITTLVMGLLRAGDKILTQANLYGGTTELFTQVIGRFGVETIFTDLRDLSGVENMLKAHPSIRLLYFETPANPTLACVDMEALAGLAKKYGVATAADNTFCTPYLQQPFLHGVDHIIHSTTKFLNGHGNSIAGVLVSKDVEWLRAKAWQAMKLAGTNCNPWDAWLVHNGMKTLTLRMDRHSQNAQALAEFLEKHPRVERVNYNGLPSHPDHQLAKRQMRQFGGMLSFELKGGLEAGIAFMKKIKFCTLAPTLGDADTLILHPASMSHLNIPKEVRLQNGITDGLIRVSVGIENVEDIRGDLEQGIDG